MFQWGMRQSAELENQMTSVERVLEYGNAPREASLESAEGTVFRIFFGWKNAVSLTYFNVIEQTRNHRFRGRAKEKSCLTKCI